MLELSDLKPKLSESGQPFKPVHPVTGEDLGIVIYLEGRDSPSYVVRQNKLVNARLAKATQNLRAVKITADSVEQEALLLLAGATKSWTNVQWEGKELECTEANALMLYSKLRWLKEQVETFVSDRANFLGN